MGLREKQKSRDELKSFGQVMALVILLLAVVPFLKGRLSGLILLLVSQAFLLSSILFPEVLRPIEKVWMAFGEKMSVVMTAIILTLTYYLAFAPLGIIMRLLGRDPLKLKLDRQAESYWEPVATDGPGSRPKVPY